MDTTGIKTVYPAVSIFPATRQPVSFARYVRLICKRVSLFVLDLCSPVYKFIPRPLSLFFRFISVRYSLGRRLIDSTFPVYF